MPETVEGHIWQALLSQLQVMAADIALPIAWPNKNFTAPADRKFLRVQHVPNSVTRTRIGSAEPHQRLGILLIAVHWPKNTFGVPVVEMAGQVAQHWPADLVMRSGDIAVRITQAPRVGDLMDEDAGVMIPVEIFWEAYA